MSTPSTVARTQPIAIVSRKPRYHAAPSSVEPSNPRDAIRSLLSASMSSTTSSAESASNTRSRKDRPCDACRRRKSRCVINTGQTSCALCQIHSQDCTFVQSPQPRKRKLNTEGKEESVAKRRYLLSSLLYFRQSLRTKDVMANMSSFIDPQRETREVEGLLSPVFRALGLRIRWLRIWQILADRRC